jgi:hypothetical protein
MKEERPTASTIVCFDIAYIRWRAEFAPFETNCFDALCEFVRSRFDSLIDRYYREGHQSLTEFPRGLLSAFYTSRLSERTPLQLLPLWEDGSLTS